MFYDVDSTLEFPLIPSDNGVYTISGDYWMQPGDTLVIGIESEEIHEPPHGFSVAEKGYYFFYLQGTGNFESFTKEFCVPEFGRPLKAFAKRWFSSGRILLSVDSADWSRHVFVLGSCVTRDSIELSELPLAGYRARFSFASFTQPPLPFAEVSLKKNPSEFQRRMVSGDLSRSNLDLASNTPGSTVAIDLVDERLPLLRFGHSIFTQSTEYQATGIRFPGTPFDNSSDEYYKLFAAGCARLSESVVHKRLLIARVFWAMNLENGEKLPDQSSIQAQNRKLSKLYTIVERECPRAEFIEFDEEDMVAACEHQWGRSPFHYAESFARAYSDRIEETVMKSEGALVAPHS